MAQTGVICTIGPASEDIATLRDMIDAGMNVARLNFSHGTREAHQKRIDTINEINRDNPQKLKILQDLEGFRIRVADLDFLNDRQIALTEGQTVVLSKGNPKSDSLSIPLDYEGSLRLLKAGTHICIDDGNIALRSLEATDDFVSCEVLVAGVVKEHKGINIPDVTLPYGGMTEKDRSDLHFGLENGVDFVAQSFVRNGQDVEAIREIINDSSAKCQLIAKIENREAIRNLDEILEAADGIMVARGDLGVSLPIYQVPILQKILVKECKHRNRFVITATQMMESMTSSLRPTRAEVSDVANAVLEDSDFVMLSGETAVGRYPVEVVKMMQQIIDFSEQSPALDYFTK